MSIYIFDSFLDNAFAASLVALLFYTPVFFIGLFFIRKFIAFRLSLGAQIFCSLGVGLVFVQQLLSVIYAYDSDAFDMSVRCIQFGGCLCAVYFWHQQRYKKFRWDAQSFTLYLPPMIGFWWLPSLLFITLLLIAALPVSDADSLDYHLGVARLILSGSELFHPEWFHSRLAGNGEILNAVGLAIGGHNFGSLSQVAGIALILGSFLVVSSDQINRSELKNFLVLAMCPFVLLAWVPSSKPFMLGVGTSCFVFALLVRWHYESSKSGSIEVPMFFTFFMGFLSVALVTIKLSFFTSALILWTFWVFQVVGASRGYRSIANHAFFWVLGASVSILSYLILFVLPYVSLPLKFSAPIFPGSFPGYDSFYEYLKDWRDSNFPFPFSLVVSDSLGHFTTALGPVTIGVLLSLKSFQTWSGAQKLGVLYASLLVMLTLLLGQLNARFFYESYLWILIALAAGRCFYFDRLTRWISRTQAAVFIVVGLSFFIPNSGSLFSNVARDEFWRDHSNGFSLGRDLMSVDYSDSQILTNVRSRASLPFDTISGDWLRFSDSPFDIEYYKSEILDLTDESFLFVDHSRIGISQFLSLCPGNVLGVFSYKPAFRNPFNARPLGIESYLTKPSSWDSCRLDLLMNKRK